MSTYYTILTRSFLYFLVLPSLPTFEFFSLLLAPPYVLFLPPGGLPHNKSCLAVRVPIILFSGPCLC